MRKGSPAGVVLLLSVAVSAQQAVPPAQQDAMRSPITSETVRRVQEALQQQGYDVGAADGRWNEQTAAALRDFQRAQGLEANGELNSRTLGALGLGGG